jgi:hypothetical protein
MGQEKVVTAIKYDVLEQILKDWLVEQFGEDATYEVGIRTAPPVTLHIHPYLFM